MTSSVSDLPMRRRVRAARLSWWRDGLVASVWILVSTGVALAIADGALRDVGTGGLIRAEARLLGIAAAVLLMSQVLLASRAPWIERAIGHDRAIAAHARLGKFAIALMLTHVGLILMSTASDSGLGVTDVFFEYAKSGRPFQAAVIAVLVFTVILIASIWAGVRRWNYEVWHTVHRLTYVGIAFAVPHQFLEGSTFRDGGFAWLFWFILYTIAFGSFLVFRMVRPVIRSILHGARVLSVRREADGSSTVEISGKGFTDLKAKPGQFFLWRFWTRRLIWQKHPYSLSASPKPERLRITVKPSGSGSRELSNVEPGTRVTFEGPLGVFTHDRRVGTGLVLAAAGIGITPIRAMLEEVSPGEPCTVVVRVNDIKEAPLLDEVMSIAATVGARVEVLAGPPGSSWAPDGSEASLKTLAPFLEDADVFICGPLAWAQMVEDEAIEAGARPDALHRERFGW